MSLIIVDNVLTSQSEAKVKYPNSSLKVLQNLLLNLRRGKANFK